MAAPSPGSPDALIIAEAREIYHSPLMQRIREAHQSSRSETVQIGKCSIQYEPLAFSGMTAFPSGFVIGKEAFGSESELKKTLLHELYRLRRSVLSQGGQIDSKVAKSETQSAFWFAEQNHVLLDNR